MSDFHSEQRHKLQQQLDTGELALEKPRARLAVGEA
jgi:hypothetical protein